MNPSIFMVGWEYPPHNSGGLGVACDGLSKALSDAGNQIYFALPYQHSKSLAHLEFIACHDPKWLEFTKAPFPSYATKKNAQRVDFLPLAQIEQKVAEYANMISKKSKKYEKKYDLIHAHDWMSFPAAQKMKNQTGKPMLAHVHSTEFDRIPRGSGSNFIKRAEYQGMQAADLIVAVSHYTKQVLIDKYDVDADKIKVVHNGIEPLKQSSVELIHFAASRPLLVFMGRLTAQKGAKYFVDLAAAVLEDLPDALFVLAGNGDQYQSLLFKAAGNQLSASVLFSGFLRGREKEILLSRADIFVMPSVSEPFGLVAAEAAQRAVPVIISKNSGVAELLSDAIQVDFWNIDEMKAQILKVINNKKYSQSIVKKQNQNLKNISWENTAKRLRDLYKDVLSR
ncbi:MAG: glycosyltransferase family 4 protein [Patescibacteria group bacterium]